MSTIEKAAARLAARQRAKADNSAPKDSDNGRSRFRESVLTLPTTGSEKAAAEEHGRLTHHFCDIDIQAIQDRGFIAPTDGRSQLAHEMRRIKRPLLLNIQKARARGESDPPPNLIMVTSALPGEGKTFISINLAMSIAAEIDRRVLLVDADVARGDVSHQLGLPPQRGLSDLLEESSYLAEDGVLDTNIERLSILPAGEPTNHVDELFASGQMAVLAKALADTDPDRVVVFDASPLLATTEAAVLAQRMGQTVVVVEANRTPQDAVAQALTHLEGCANVCLILNKTTGTGSGGYSYGYGYGYGREVEEERKMQPEAAE